MGTCRSCGAQVVWVTMASGKTMPIDPVAVEGGNIVLETDNRGVTTALVRTESKHGYKSHFATCPNAKQHRKPSARAEPRKPKVSLDDITAAFERNKGGL